MKKFSTFVVTLFLWPSFALGSTGSGVLTPITKVARDIREDLTGGMGREIVLLACAAAAIVWMLTEHGHGIRKVGGVLVGGALLFGGFQIINALFVTGAVF